MVRFAATMFVAAVVAVLPAQAGKYNKVLSIGDACPTFENLPAVDGKKYSITDFRDKDVLVVCITCNHCPMAVAYEDRIIDLVKKQAGGESKVAFVAINVNNGDADRLPKMVERSKEKGFNFTYLYDESQKIARSLGASVTPEFFVFDKNRKLVYTGALDDNPRDADQVKNNFVEAGVKAALTGAKPEVAETRPIGCGVQYERRAN